MNEVRVELVSARGQSVSIKTIKQGFEGSECIEPSSDRANIVSPLRSRRRNSGNRKRGIISHSSYSTCRCRHREKEIDPQFQQR